EGGRHRTAADAILTPAPKPASAAAAAVAAARGGAAAAAAAAAAAVVADEPGRHLHQQQQGSHRPLHEVLLQPLHSRRRRSPHHPHRLHRLRPHLDRSSCHSYPESAKNS
ncbi:unnamed protein product, partial [Closterium sp. NIES-54]